MKVRGRVMAILTCLSFVIMTSTVSADANLGAQATNLTPLSLQTGTFKIAPEVATNGILSGTQIITNTLPNGDNYFYYVNTGTIDVKAFTWAISFVSGTNKATVTQQCQDPDGHHGSHDPDKPRHDLQELAARASRCCR